MILSGLAIREARSEGEIIIDPFDVTNVTTNSYDFHLGGEVLTYLAETLDPRIDNPTRRTVIPEAGLLLKPGNLYLGHTLEVMGSTNYVPIIKGKSSIARLGLFIHATADLIDIGSVNQWTLQLIPTLPVVVYPQMSIGQVTFWELLGEATLYTGKYQGSRGPQPSLAHKDQFT